MTAHANDHFIMASLALHGTPTYLPSMFARRLVSGVMALIAVQYAAFGAGSLCTTAHHSPGSGPEVTAGMAQHRATADGPTSPCAPTSPDSHSTHVPLSCLAMAGCAAPGLAAVVAPEVAASPLTIAVLVTEAATLRSVLSPPETPPPIA